MSFWEKIKSDLEQGLVEGIDILKEGAAFVKKKTEELTEEGKRRVNLFELKTKVRQEMTELGGQVYDLNIRGKVFFRTVQSRQLWSGSRNLRIR